MNIRKYIIPMMAVAAMLTSCLDKNDTPPSGWTSIASVEGMTIPGALYGRVSLNEGSLLEINPVFQYREGYSESDFSFYWVMGGDTISSSKNLSWVVIPSDKIQINPSSSSTDRYAYLWLAVYNAKTDEEWRLYPEANNMLVKIFFQSATTPNIGVIVYEKSGNKLEWATVMGNDRTAPEKFSELTVDMYERYNPEREITGPYVGGSFYTTLRIYTNSAPDYGVNIQAGDGKDVPMGYYMNTVATEGFETAPTKDIVRKNYYQTMWQEILVGDQLFVSPANSSYTYQYLNPNGAGNLSGVAQTLAPIPMGGPAPFGIIRMSSGELRFSEYNSVYGFRTAALLNGNGQALNVDKLLGVFREPVSESLNYEARIFVVVKSGTAINIHEYIMKKGSELSVLVEVSFSKTVEVTGWSGVNDHSIWFSTGQLTARNYAYFTSGKDVYRFSFLELQNPVRVKSFADEITSVAVARRQINSTGEDYYTAVLTYNSGADKSAVYFVDATSDTMTQFSAIENTIPGKALDYFPYY